MGVYSSKYYRSIAEQRYLAGQEEYLNSSLTLRQVCEKHNLNRNTLSHNLRSQGFSTRKKIDVDDTIFEKIDTEEKAYWLGFLYADGSVVYKPSSPTRYCIELGLAAKDFKHLEKYRRFLKTWKQIKFREGTNSYRLYVTSKKMCEDLIELGCTPRKSLTLIFPTEEQVPETLIRHFIRGYFDGDGHIELSKGSKRLMKVQLLGTKEFLESIIESLNLIGTRIIKKDKRHLNNTWYIELPVEEGMRFLRLIYGPAHVYLNRKHNSYLWAFTYRLNCEVHGKNFYKKEVQQRIAKLKRR